MSDGKAITHLRFTGKGSENHPFFGLLEPGKPIAVHAGPDAQARARELARLRDDVTAVYEVDAPAAAPAPDKKGSTPAKPGDKE